MKRRTRNGWLIMPAVCRLCEKTVDGAYDDDGELIRIIPHACFTTPKIGQIKKKKYLHPTDLTIIPHSIEPKRSAFLETQRSYDGCIDGNYFNKFFWRNMERKITINLDRLTEYELRKIYRALLTSDLDETNQQAVETLYEQELYIQQGVNVDEEHLYNQLN